MLNPVLFLEFIKYKNVGVRMNVAMPPFLVQAYKRVV